MLRVKLLDPAAKAPTVNTPGEDLAYDLCALESATLYPGLVVNIRTGIAIEFTQNFGGLVRDRSSMASKGVTVSGGVIDAGYRGEIKVLLTLSGAQTPYSVAAGDKIAQLIPIKPVTHQAVKIVDRLTDSQRGNKGFGSSGK